MKRPEDLTELRAFLGSVNYYAKFIDNISRVLYPLYKLLQKNVKFIWKTDCEKAFKKIKNIIASDVVLIHFNPDLKIKLVCDASKIGIGSVWFITQNGRRYRKTYRFCKSNVIYSRTKLFNDTKGSFITILGSKKFLSVFIR